MHGELAATEQAAQQALEIGGAAGEPDAYMVFGSQISMVRWMQGRANELTELVEQTAQAYPRIHAWKSALAAVLCWVGRVDEAAAIVEQAAADGFEHVPWDLVRLTTLAQYADAASQAQLSGAAATLYDLIEPWGNQMVWNGANSHGHAATYLGLTAATVGRDDLADEHFRVACEFHEQHGMPGWAARSHQAWAEALAARGERDLAREHAARALELSRKHGYGLFEPRAAAILEAGSPVG